MNRITLGLFVTLAMLAGSRSRAADDVGAGEYRQQLARQEAIYRAAEEPKGYVTDRGLDAYAETLPAEFDASLWRLGPGDRWLDIGAGRGQAIIDYVLRGRSDPAQQGAAHLARNRARAVAISLEDRRTPLWQQAAASLDAGQIQYFHSRRLEDFSPVEIGRFQVITDLLGGFSYTSDLSGFITRVLSLLEVKGSFYTVLQDVNPAQGGKAPFYAGSPWLTEIRRRDGSEMKVCSWLQRIGCAQVSCELRADWRPPIEAYRVQKTCGEVQVPALQRVHYQAGTPPERRFLAAE